MLQVKGKSLDLISNIRLHSLQKLLSTSTISTNIDEPVDVKPFSQIPGPPRLPFLGNLYLYKLGYYKMADYHNVLRELNNKYGPVVREDIGSETIIHVFDPNDVRKVHGVGGKTPEVPPLQKAAQLYRQQRGLSPGLGNINGEEWYRLRSATQQMMMRPKEVHHYLPFTDQAAQQLVKKIATSKTSDHEVLDLRMLAAKWNLEASGMVCFEKKLECLGKEERRAEDLIRANIDIFHLSACLKFSLNAHKYFTTPKWRQFLAAEDFFYETATKFMDEALADINRLAQQKALKENQYNFLTYLLSRKDLTEKDVRIITFSLFADGLSTTTPALLFNLYCLAKNTDAQEKVYLEGRNYLPKAGYMTVEVLNNLQYLKAAVKETFRLYPGGTEVSRIIPTNLILGNYQVPAGTHVDLNQFVLFRSPTYFTEPDKFLPERWMRENQSSTQEPGNEIGTSSSSHPFLLTPFGHGTRMCAGRRFAEQDLYTCLSRIVQRFKLQLVDPGESLEQVYSTLLFPKHPLRIRFVPRLGNKS